MLEEFLQISWRLLDFPLIPALKPLYDPRPVYNLRGQHDPAAIVIFGMKTL